MQSNAAAPADCRQCSQFDDDPASLERRLAGLTILGSAYGSVRGAAGICEVLQRFMEPLDATGCPHFRPREGETGAEHGSTTKP
jgi:hypothetical protein